MHRAVMVTFILLLLAPFAALAGGTRTSLGLKSPHCHMDSRSEGLLCKGRGGWTVAIGYHTLRRTIVFIPAGRAYGDTRDSADGLSVIPVDIARPRTALWLKSAVVVPVLIVLPEDFEQIAGIGVGSGGVPTKAILEVFRLGEEGSCVIAYVDADDTAADALALRAASGADRARCPVASVARPGIAAATLADYIKE